MEGSGISDDLTILKSFKVIEIKTSLKSFLVKIEFNNDVSLNIICFSKYNFMDKI